MIFRHVGILALALAVAACGAPTMERERAEDTAQLHEHAPQWFKDYWKQYVAAGVDARVPPHYALALDGGSAGFSYCKSHLCDPTAYRQVAMQTCEQRGKFECDIYAVGTRIVWPHAFPWRVAENRQSAPVATRPETTRGTSQRTFTLSWVGSTVVHAGTLEIKPGQRSGRTTLLVGGQECDGQFWFTSGRRGQWEVDCGDGWLSASGEFTATGGPNGGSRGTGTDNQGRMVEFVVDPAGG